MEKMADNNKKKKLKLKIFSKKKKPDSKAYKKELKTKKNMEMLRNENVTKKKKKNTNYNETTKDISKPLLLFLIGFGILCFAIFYKIFDIIVTAGLLFLYIIIVVFTQILDLTRTNSKIRKTIKTLCIIVIIFGIIGILGFVGFFTYIVIKSPAFNVANLETKETTLVYDNSNKIIATLGDEKREKVSYNELPEVLVDAIIATEDSRFFQHNGFDAPRFIKAAIGQVMGRNAGGASTLTMQLAKNRFSSTDVSLTRKFTDIYLSIFKIERAYTKQEIIEFYVNIPYLGNYSYGVEQACQGYFNKHASEINLAEASIIAGLFQAPGDYDPTVYPEYAYERRETVLDLMVRHGYITQEEADMANKIGIEDLLKESTTSTNPYQGYIDLAVNEVEKETGLNPYTYSMEIYTNMDTKMQEGINDVFNGKTYDWPNDTIQAGVAVVDSQTGKILAVGAGRNRVGERVMSYATDINRQIGSTAKPLFDYAPGIEYNNWSTGKIFNDTRVNYAGGVMENFDGAYLGEITLRYSLRDSRNVPALLAFREVDNEKIKNFVVSLGITPEIDSGGGLHEAHAVGAFNGSNPLSMTGAYASFSNGGYHYDTHSVYKVILRDSNEPIEFKSTKTKVMSDSTAYMITDVLRGVATDYGIRSSANVDLACKTGTTNYDADTREDLGYPYDADPDGWMACYSSKTAMVMWTGYNENIKGRYIRHSLMYTHRTGLYKALAEIVFDGSGAKNFTKPNSVTSVTIEKGTELLPSDNTPSDQKITELFKRGTEPTEVSQKYVPLENVTNATIKYKNGKVTLGWYAAPEAKGNLVVKEPGEFGYIIYKDGNKLSFTTELTYTDETDTPYGEYKIVTAYKNMTTNHSSGTVVSMNLNITFQYNDTLEETVDLNSIISPILNPITVFKDGIDVTKNALITTKIINLANNKEESSINTTTEGQYQIVYSVSYLGKKETYRKTVTIKNNKPDIPTP